MKLFGMQGMVDVWENRRANFDLFEFTRMKLMCALKRHIRSTADIEKNQEVAYKYDLRTDRYILYATLALLNAKETRALVNFMETWENTDEKQDAFHAAEELFRALYPYNFSPDVKEGEFGAPLV